ncbi:hypothetical protein ACIA8K_29690 [Catenuloplanes sp. NPDC051500]|uniref:hypothetical protein n=1 Tax=Catenuloplanes sp. NPDC051500 TaxID=3363959 RepID=UPI00379737FA
MTSPTAFLQICANGRFIPVPAGVFFHDGPMSTPVRIGALTTALSTPRLTGGTAIFVPEPATRDPAALHSLARAMDSLPTAARDGLVLGWLADDTFDPDRWLGLTETVGLQKHAPYRDGVPLGPRVVGVDAQGLETGSVPAAIRVLPATQAAARETLKIAARLSRDTVRTPWARLEELLAEAARLRGELGVRPARTPAPASAGYQLAAVLTLLGPPVGLDLDRFTRGVLPVTAGQVLAALRGSATGERIPAAELARALSAAPGTVAVIRTEVPGTGEEHLRLLASRDGSVHWVDAEQDGEPLSPFDPAAGDRRTTELGSSHTAVTLLDPAGRVTTLAGLLAGRAVRSGGEASASVPRADTRADLAALRARLTRPGLVSDGALRELDRIRREAFGGAVGDDSGYPEMIRALLASEDDVTGARLTALAELVHAERVRVRKLGTRARNTASNVLELLHLRGADRTPPAGLRSALNDPGRVDLRELAAAAMRAHWPREHRPAGGLPAELVDAAHGHDVPGLQYVYDIANLPELSEWLTSLLPVPGAVISPERLRSALTSGFTASLDEGVPLRVPVGGDTYLINLFADVTGPPRKLSGVDTSARLETRVNVTEEMQRLVSRTWSAVLELGPATRLGARLIAALLAYITGGITGGAGRSGTAAVSTAVYTFFKPSEAVEAVRVPLGFSASVSREGGTAFRHEVWRGRDGTVRQEDAKLYVGRSQVPGGVSDTHPVPDNRALPIWRMHVGVERVHAARQLRKAVYDAIGPAEYAFWRAPLDRFLSQDPLSGVLLDAYDPDAGFQDRPRLMLREGARHLSLALAARADRIVVPRTGTTKVMVDKTKVNMTKGQQGRERRFGYRGTAGAAFRAAAGLFSYSRRYGVTRTRGRQSMNTQRIFSQTATRSNNPNRVPRVETTFTLDLAWGTDGAATARRTVPDVKGFFLGRFRDAELNAHLASFDGWTAPTAPPTRKNLWTKLSGGDASWWSPTADGRHGIGYGGPTGLTGIRTLYDSLVPYLVRKDYLPAAARPATGSAWDHLQGLSATGEELNKSGWRYDNWRILVDQVSERYLTRRAADLTSGTSTAPGMPIVFSGGFGRNDLTIGLSAVLGTASTYLETDNIWNLNSYSSQAGVTTRRTKTVSVDRSRDINGVLGNQDYQLPEPVNLGAVHTRAKAHREVVRAGESVSANVQSAAAMEMEASRFAVGAAFHWWAYDGTSKTPMDRSSGPLAGEVELWQPNPMTATETKPAADGGPGWLLPNLAPISREYLDRGADGTRELSPLAGLTPRAAISASGLAELRTQVAAKSSASYGQILDAMGMSWYKASLPHAFQGGIPALPGQEKAMLRVRPIGRPQIIDKVTVYNDYTLESQTGSLRDTEIAKSLMNRMAGGWRTGLAGDAAGATYGWGSTKGTQEQVEETAGAYRTWTGFNDMYMVRTYVENVYTTEDGDKIKSLGEVIMMVSAEDLHTRYQRFDEIDVLIDGYSLPDRFDLAAQELNTDRRLPAGLRAGRPWAGIYLDPIGKSRLHREIGRAAKGMGGAHLKFAVLERMVGLLTHLPELTDDGKAWLITLGRKTYELRIRVDLQPTARYINRGRRDRTKQYLRVNKGSSGAARVSTLRSAGVTGGFSTINRGISDEASMPMTANITGAKVTDAGRGRTANMLSMTGVRPQDAAKFGQDMIFDWELAELSAIRPARRQGQVKDNRLVYTAFGGTRHDGEQPADLSGVQLGLLPDSARLLGVQGLRALADLVTAPATARRDRAKVVEVGVLDQLRDVTILTQNRLLADFRTAQRTVGGMAIAGLNTGSRRLLLADGTRLGMRFGAVRDAFYIRSAELEEYEHGTQGLSEGSGSAMRISGDIAANVQVPTEPMVYAGGRFTLGGDVSFGRGVNRIQASEHRAWLRRTYTSDGVFQVFADVELTMQLPSGATPRVAGTTEFVLDRAAALEAGFTAEQLRQIQSDRIAATTDQGDRLFFRADVSEVPGLAFFDAVQRSAANQGVTLPVTAVDGRELMRGVADLAAHTESGFLDSLALPAAGELLLRDADERVLRQLAAFAERTFGLRVPPLPPGLAEQAYQLEEENQLRARAARENLPDWRTMTSAQLLALRDGTPRDTGTPEMAARLREAQLLYLREQLRSMISDQPVEMLTELRAAYQSDPRRYDGMAALISVHLDELHRTGEFPDTAALITAALADERLHDTPVGDAVMTVTGALLGLELRLVDSHRIIAGTAAPGAPPLYLRRTAGRFDALVRTGGAEAGKRRALDEDPDDEPSGALPQVTDDGAPSDEAGGSGGPVGHLTQIDSGLYLDSRQKIWRRRDDDWEPVDRIEQEIEVNLVRTPAVPIGAPSKAPPALLSWVMSEPWSGPGTLGLARFVAEAADQVVRQALTDDHPVAATAWRQARSELRRLGRAAHRSSGVHPALRFPAPALTEAVGTLIRAAELLVEINPVLAGAFRPGGAVREVRTGADGVVRADGFTVPRPRVEAHGRTLVGLVPASELAAVTPPDGTGDVLVVRAEGGYARVPVAQSDGTVHEVLMTAGQVAAAVRDLPGEPVFLGAPDPVFQELFRAARSTRKTESTRQSPSARSTQEAPDAHTAHAPLLLGDWSGVDPSVWAAAGRPVVAANLGGPATASGQVLDELRDVLAGYWRSGISPVVVATETTATSGELFEALRREFAPVLIAPVPAGFDRVWLLQSTGRESMLMRDRLDRELLAAAGGLPGPDVPAARTPGPLGAWLLARTWAEAASYHRAHRDTLHTPDAERALAGAIVTEPGNARLAAYRTVLGVARDSGGRTGEDVPRLAPVARSVLDVEPQVTVDRDDPAVIGFVYDYLATLGPRADRYAMDGLLYRLMLDGVLRPDEALDLVRATVTTPVDRAALAVFEAVVALIRLPADALGADPMTDERLRQIMAKLGGAAASTRRAGGGSGLAGTVRNVECVDPADRTAWIGRLDVLREVLHGSDGARILGVLRADPEDRAGPASPAEPGLLVTLVEVATYVLSNC